MGGAHSLGGAHALTNSCSMRPGNINSAFSCGGNIKTVNHPSCTVDDPYLATLFFDADTCLVQVAYVPQSAFIYNASVRDNILFGLPFEQERYDQAIAAAAVRPDLDNMQGMIFSSYVFLIVAHFVDGVHQAWLPVSMPSSYRCCNYCSKQCCRSILSRVYSLVHSLCHQQHQHLDSKRSTLL